MGIRYSRHLLPFLLLLFAFPPVVAEADNGQADDI